MSSVFSSLEAHNGCRVLFNHVQGWAYVGPSGLVNAKDFPGTVSYPLKQRRSGGVSASEQAVRRISSSNREAGASRGSESLNEAGHAVVQGSGSRNGTKLPRKASPVLRAVLHDEHLEFLVEEARERVRAGGAAGQGAREQGDVDEAPDTSVANGSRRGLPIVVILQEILRRTSPSGRDQAGEGTASQEGSSTHSKQHQHQQQQGRVTPEALPQITDHAQFPPLRSPELVLARPIVVEPSTGGLGAGGVPGVETAVLLAGKSGGSAGHADSSEAGQKLSNVGWWLRWALPRGNAHADEPGSDSGPSSSSTALPEVTSGASRPIAGNETSERRFPHALRECVDGWELLSVGSTMPRTTSPTASRPRDGGLLSWVDDLLSVGCDIDDASDGYASSSSWCDCRDSDLDVADLPEDVIPVPEPESSGERGQGLPGLPPDRGSPAGNSGFNQVAAPCFSYKDVLMMPTAAGKTEFTLSKAASMKRAQRRRVCVRRPPTVLPQSGAGLRRHGIAVRGLLGRAPKDLWDEEEEFEDDLYYGRKRYGAMAYARKPRGRGHK